jgi:hypothetical protein
VTYLERWARRLPLYRLAQTVAYQDQLREKGLLDAQGRGRLALLRMVWRERSS